MVRTRSSVRNNPTVIELKQKAREQRKREWLLYYDTLVEPIRKKEIKDYFSGLTFGIDEVQDDTARLFIRVIYGFPFEDYIPITSEFSIIIVLLREYEKSVSRQAYPGITEALISDCAEDEAKMFMMSRRALVCSYLERLQQFREKITLREVSWAEGLRIYKSLALTLFKEILETVTYLHFLKGEELEKAINLHSKWAKENVIPVVQMLLTAFSDDTVDAPVLFEDFPKKDETFLSYDSTFTTAAKAKNQAIFEDKELEGAGAFLPGLQSTMQGDEQKGESPFKQESDAHYFLKQQKINAVLENKSLDSQQKQILLKNLMEEEGEREEQDSLSRRFQLQQHDDPAEIYNAPQPYSNQYHSLPDVKLPKFHGNPLEFHKFYSMFTCLVDKNPKIPKIMKLHLLNDALKGTANYLTHQITFSPGSYDQLKKNLVDAFGDTESALSQLRERLTAWPILSVDNYKDLAVFFGFATNYVMSLMQYEDGASFNAKNVLHDLHCKFNTRMRSDYKWSLGQEETLKGKLSDRDKLNFMLEWLKEQVSILRTFYHADPKNPKLPLGMPTGIAMEFGESRGRAGNRGARKKRVNQRQDNESKETTTVLATDTNPVASNQNAGASGDSTRGGRGGGRGRGGRGGRGRGGRGRGRGRGQASSTLQHPTSSGEKAGQYAGAGFSEREVHPCCFCGNPKHSAHNCTQHMKPDTVYLKALEFSLCLNCLKLGHWASACPHPGCAKDNCNARHHPLMHGHSTNPPQAPKT